MTTYTEKENLPFPLVRPLRRNANRAVVPPEGARESSRAREASGDLERARLDRSATPTPDSLHEGWFASKLELEEETSPRVDAGIYPDDRLSPGLAGGLMGAFAATVSLVIVHAIAPAMIEQRAATVAAAREVDVALAFALAYGSVAAIGGLVGTTFAIVTRYLRKWFALLVWALVFFVSLGMLLLAANASTNGVSSALAQPVLLACAVFAVLVSFSLPIRRRR
jgi:hypothetical protein